MAKNARVIIISTAVIVLLSIGTAFLFDSWSEYIELDRIFTASSEDILTFIWAAENLQDKIDQDEMTETIIGLADIIPAGEAGDKWTEVKITNGLLTAQGLGNNMGWIVALNEPTSLIRENIKMESGYLESCFVNLRVAWDRMYKMQDTQTAIEYCGEALNSLNLWLEQRELNKEALANLKAEVESFNAA